jgi:uroporphyrin-III C-methyltransferase
MDAAARFRDRVRGLNLARHESERMYDRFFAATVADDLKTRVPPEPEQAAWITPRGEPLPRVTSGQVAPLAANVGFVSLVGGGPGDPGLLTVRGRQRLLRADAVVYDRLAITSIPPDLPAQVELRGVGKVAGHHPTPQVEINALLVRLAREGKRVVRLKGGDPYVFGRGGEEAEALREAGIPFEVVPCVTAGVAAPAYAGIPVTQRREAVRVTMVTAHEAVKSKGPQVRWDMLASDPHLTLLGYMGVTSIPEVVHQLLAAGMDPATPAAMIERGTTASQKVVHSTVAHLPRAVVDGGIEPPALFVIGRTVRYASELNWFMERPLFGERIAAFDPEPELAETLELAGVELVDAPSPITPAARLVLGALPLTGWLFRNGDEVEVVEEDRDGPGWDPRQVAWCLDDSAAERAVALGWQKVHRAHGPPIQIVAALAARARARAAG